MTGHTKQHHPHITMIMTEHQITGLSIMHQLWECTTITQIYIGGIPQDTITTMGINIFTLGGIIISIAHPITTQVIHMLYVM
jgi:hypothetical protein